MSREVAGLPILPRLPAKNAKFAGVAESTEIAGFDDPHCRNCDKEIWPRLPAENGRFHAEIEKKFR